MVVEARSLKSRYQRGCAPSGGMREASVPGISSDSLWPQVSLAWRRIIPPSVDTHASHGTSLCPNLPFYKVTSRSEFGPKPNGLILSC